MGIAQGKCTTSADRATITSLTLVIVIDRIIVESRADLRNEASQKQIRKCVKKVEASGKKSEDSNK